MLETLPLLEAAVGDHGMVGLPDGLLDPVRVPVSGAVEGGVVRSNGIVGLEGVAWLTVGGGAGFTGPGGETGQLVEGADDNPDDKLDVLLLNSTSPDLSSEWELGSMIQKECPVYQTI